MQRDARFWACLTVKDSHYLNAVYFLQITLLQIQLSSVYKPAAKECFMFKIASLSNIFCKGDLLLHTCPGGGGSRWLAYCTETAWHLWMIVYYNTVFDWHLITWYVTLFIGYLKYLCVFGNISKLFFVTVERFHGRIIYWLYFKKLITAAIKPLWLFPICLNLKTNTRKDDMHSLSSRLCSGH